MINNNFKKFVALLLLVSMTGANAADFQFKARQEAQEQESFKASS